MHKKTLVLLIVLGLTLSAAAQDKAKWKYDNSEIQEVKGDTIVAEGRTLSLEGANLINEYEIDLADVENGKKIVVKGKWNDDKSVLDCRNARVITYEPNKYGTSIGGWGGIGTVLVQNGKLFAEFGDNVAHEIKLQGALHAESQIKKEDLKQGMTIQYRFKETSEPYPVKDISVKGKIVEENADKPEKEAEAKAKADENASDSEKVPVIKIQEVNTGAK